MIRKNFFATITFALTLSFGGLSNVAAQDVYIESEYGGGRDVYVVTESIDTNGVDYVHVTLKFLRGNSLIYVEHRKYGKTSDGMWWFSSEESKRENLRATRVWKPKEDKILQYCLHYR